MLIIGVTGQIATGKSTIAKLIAAKKKAALFDADQVIAKLYSKKSVLKQIAKLSNKLNAALIKDRAKFARFIFARPAMLKDLENILHPLLRKELKIFLRKALLQKKQQVILDVPLLFQSGMNNICDIVLITKSSKLRQQVRFFNRKGATQPKLNNILKKQHYSFYNIKKADMVINNNFALNHNKQIIDKFIRGVNARSSTGYRNYGFKHRRWR